MSDELTDALQAVTAGLDYPMLVVTAAAGGAWDGCLVGFASQCSIVPFRLAVWLSKANRTYALACDAPALAVHWLAADQRALADRFGGQTADRQPKLDGVATHAGPLGTVVLDDCGRWAAGPVLGRHDTGDHVCHVIEPVAAAAGGWVGQLGYQMVRDLTPGHPEEAG